MSDVYYVNKIAQSSGEHEVHASSCRYLPSVENRIFWGYFANGKEAVREAKNTTVMLTDVSFAAPKHIQDKNLVK